MNTTAGYWPVRRHQRRREYLALVATAGLYGVVPYDRGSKGIQSCWPTSTTTSPTCRTGERRRSHAGAAWRSTAARRCGRWWTA